MQYLQYEFFSANEDEQQWLMVLLSELPFEGFEQTNITVMGYIKADAVEDGEVRAMLNENNFAHIQFAVNAIEQKNWNEEWEKNFQPVVIAESVGIRAPFHAPLKTEIELVIEPKMSFGTGHHATTASMIELLLRMDVAGKKVLDMGCGTGVLAILARKLGAGKTVAIDHEEWAVENAAENAERNHVEIEVIRGDAAMELEEKFDVLLANINRNVIAEKLESWMKLMKPSADVLLSGFMEQDVDFIRTLCATHQLSEQEILQQGEWVAMRFSK